MLATATHDHKRGEDVRARLAVLSELADEWCGALDRWLKKSANISVERDISPTPDDIAMLLQMIIAAWPLNLKLTDKEGLEAYRIRIAAWQQKALREAKLRSDWSAPDEAYESAATDFLGAVFSEREIIDDLYNFSERIAAPGAINGLSQVLIKLTVPGVPDTYQGTEYWDLSLVDPDNRTAVDFAARRSSFLSSSSNLLLDWRNGLVKQALVSRVLAVRKDRPNLFAEGNYIALEVAGPFSEHFLAFARVTADDACIVIVPRFVALQIRDSAILSFACKALQATTLSLSRALHGRYRNAMSGTDVDLRNGVSIAALLENWPVGILLRAATSKDG
jgi:(1->4)-alpha-D-glucan 1-alpha-D-glucosylmutase